ncbi:MAG: M3 family oligoendopeptidase, partial [Clostridium perfringens]|nr:M3 family oligoendopeptidase [Clostridium perfringens]
MSEVKKLRRRDEIPEGDKWRIDKIYETPAKWNEELNKLKEEAPKLKNFEGKLGNKEDLKAFLLLNEKLSRKLGKLYVYAHMRSHEDTSNPEMQSLVNKIDPYSAEFSSYTAYFVPEILSLKEGTIENFINEDKDLEQYKIYFEMILNEKPHILSKEVESVLASVSDCLGAPESIYSMLTNSDMTFGEILDESGRKVELSEGNYNSFIKSKDRKVREAAFKLLFGTYKKYENTLATSLSSSIKNFVFESKTRKYNSSLEASLKPNNIPVEVYHNALKTVDENMDALHRYVRIKKKLLNLDEIHMYDLYVPVIECKKEHLEYKDAISLVEEGLKPLGKEYLDIFNKGISEGWIDVYENKGKRSGAYSWGSYDTMPYVLLNYNYE